MATTLDDLAIEVKGTSREFVYTNKHDAFLYGETNADLNRSGWQGFNVFGHEFLDNYVVLINGIPLHRDEAATLVYPDYLKRTYLNGITEEVRLADSIPLFSVTITSPRTAVRVEVLPYISTDSQSDFTVQRVHSTVMAARRSHISRTSEDDYPVWLAGGGIDFEEGGSTQADVPGLVLFSLIAKSITSGTVAFAVTDDPRSADSLISRYLRNRLQYHSQRRERMERLLGETEVRTASMRFDKALAWAKLSLDALLMNQRTKGIFAGLPWFNNYWGRDTFISLPGATLVTGRFDEARDILISFGRYQQDDTLSTDYGRIPNVVTTKETAYNTADATPRFVLVAKDYVERSGDRGFVAEVYPIIKRSIDGTIKYHTDTLGFLTHADAETWMDAVGPSGPWSPRGNRANDIQALWVQQLEAGAWFATLSGDENAAVRWRSLAVRVRTNFLKEFVSATNIHDHLNRDGTADHHLRPNQIFAVPLLHDSIRAKILKTVATKLTYEYGVASLSQEDVDFHPYHQLPGLYPKDAAYHNGTVWTWLQGPIISELCHFNRQELAARVSVNTVHQILDRGAVGTQSELLDAIPRNGNREPDRSGTVSQAWNLAEFVRNFYDDYLGVRVERLSHTLWIRPRIPAFMGTVRATINLNGRAIPVEIDQHSKQQTVRINSSQLNVGGRAIVELPANGGRILRTTFALPPRAIVELTTHDETVSVTLDDKPHAHESAISDDPVARFSRDTFDLARPVLQSNLRSLRGPEYPLLANNAIKSTNAGASILADEDDPEGDDIGTGKYVYPKHPAFVAGCFDITHATIAYDTSNIYFMLKFRSLSNPGWHPEYGFQLTFVAIAIDTDGVKGSGTRLVPQNAQYMLGEQHAFERLVLIGGGVEVRDNDGRTLCAYIPAEGDIGNPLGNTKEGTISFAIPLLYIGTPTDRWTFTILSGGQDDHGGAGLGEFRSVNTTAGEWNGGGKLRPEDTNVYDTMLVPKR